MERVVTKYESSEEADEADKRYYRSLTPLQRLEILTELNRRLREAHGIDPDARPALVCRIIGPNGELLRELRAPTDSPISV